MNVFTLQFKIISIIRQLQYNASGLLQNWPSCICTLHTCRPMFLYPISLLSNDLTYDIVVVYHSFFSKKLPVDALYIIAAYSRYV